MVNSRTSNVKKNLENIDQVFKTYLLLAMVSFTKIFVVSLRPKLTVLFTYPLHGSVKYLPIINWQFVIMQSNFSISRNKNKPNENDDSFVNKSKRFVTPILACARESAILFFQIDYSLKKYINYIIPHSMMIFGAINPKKSRICNRENVLIHENYLFLAFKKIYVFNISRMYRKCFSTKDLFRMRILKKVN